MEYLDNFDASIDANFIELTQKNTKSMNYSLKTELGKPNKEGRRKVYIKVNINKNIYRIHSDTYTYSEKLTPDVLLIVNKKKVELESIILNAIQNKLEVTREVLNGENITDRTLITNYIETIHDRLKGKFSEGRLRHYKVLKGKIEEFRENAVISDINVAFLETFESYLYKSGLVQNTVASKMSIFRAVINRAISDKLMSIESIERYNFPSERETIPVYLTEEELNKFETLVFSLGDTSKKIAGMYFLLACYAGYRISDIYLFDYEKMVNGDRITIRADKNHNIISMPIHSKLKIIVDYIKDKPIPFTQEEFRKKVKSIASDLGFKKTVKIHSGRHTFAMFLMAKGFTVDEVAKYLGDSINVARVYAKISPKTLDDKILKVFS